MTVFTSRHFLIHNDFEEVSLRDTVIWRIENSDISLGQVQLSFRVDLYCSKKPMSSFYRSDDHHDLYSSTEEEGDLNEQDEVSLSSAFQGESSSFLHIYIHTYIHRTDI